jgi:hypothetical protein
MKLYSAQDQNGRLIIGSCLSVEDCISSTIKRINVEGFSKTFLEKENLKERKFKFNIAETEMIYVEGEGTDFTDDKVILNLEITLTK